MKNLTLTFLSILFAVSLYGQPWTTSGSSIYYNGGNVGIGTTAPETQLMINSTYSKMALGKVPANSRGALGWAATYIGFNVAENGSGWATAGDGNANGGAALLTDPFGRFSILNIPSTGAAGQYLSDSQLAARARFTVGTTGNVGIGDQASEARTPLEVRRWGNNASISTALTLAQLNDASPNNAAGVAMDFSIGNNYSNNNIEARLAVKETYWGVKPKMIFSLLNESNTMTERFFINWDGNVGIGQATPTNKLDVNGTIHAKEVKVDIIGWSDFVFDKNYDLLPLTDLEKFIAKHRHLPEVPTTADVQKNGVELGAMNALLLQKIEELTLYMIQQQKTNDDQSKRIEDLERQLSKN